jgi:hypothetical protein
MRRMVDRAKRSGDLRADVDVQAVSDVLFALLRGLTELSASIPVERHRAALLCTEAFVRGELFIASDTTSP